MILFRFILIGLVIYLVVRLLIGYVDKKESFSGKQDIGKNNNANNKKVSKEIGEYVDYEDVDK